MILGKKEIIRRLNVPVSNPESIVVTPLLQSDAIDEDAIDLRLGTDFILSRSDRLAVNVPGHAAGEEFQRQVHVPLGRYLIVPGHQTVLAATLEYIKVPPGVSAMVLTKSSWARTFITVETAPWVHPRYRGCLTLEIANVSETPLALYPGQRLAQLIFFQVEDGELQKEDRLSGTYLGPIKPEPAMLVSPVETLFKELGIKRKDVHTPWDKLRMSDHG